MDSKIVICRVLQDLEPFMGTDARTYDLKKEDVVTLPKPDAMLLLEKGFVKIRDSSPIRNGGETDGF